MTKRRFLDTLSGSHAGFPDAWYRTAARLRRVAYGRFENADGVIESRIVGVTSPDASSTARQREAKTNHSGEKEGQTPMSATGANA